MAIEMAKKTIIDAITDNMIIKRLGLCRLFLAAIIKYLSQRFSLTFGNTLPSKSQNYLTDYIFIFFLNFVNRLKYKLCFLHLGCAIISVDFYRRTRGYGIAGPICLEQKKTWKSGDRLFGSQAGSPGNT
ncbi:MAG: hypothetical protein Q8O09_02715 [Bacillota bacterium]|nr:hypothetical protein [Bacillota bacterium]